MIMSSTGSLEHSKNISKKALGKIKKTENSMEAGWLRFNIPLKEWNNLWNLLFIVDLL